MLFIFSSKKYLQTVGLIILALNLSGCSGVMFPTFQQMVVNFSQYYPDIWRMITGAAYIMGMSFVFRAVFQLKAYGDMRTMMSSNASLKGPLLLFIVGAALLYSPTAFQSIMLSSFGYAEAVPIAYSSGNTLWNQTTMQALLGLVQIIGLIAFIRGWLILGHLGNPGQQASFGKAMTHLIGGVLAINVEGTRQMFQATFGIT